MDYPLDSIPLFFQSPGEVRLDSVGFLWGLLAFQRSFF